MKKNKKGSVTLYITFFISAIIIILITGVIAPMGVHFNTEMYKAGERIILQSNTSISSIQDAEVKASVQGNLAEAVSASETNIEVSSDLFQYSWIFVLVLTGIILYLLTRTLVQYSGGGIA